MDDTPAHLYFLQCILDDKIYTVRPFSRIDLALKSAQKDEILRDRIITAGAERSLILMPYFIFYRIPRTGGAQVGAEAPPQ